MVTRDEACPLAAFSFHYEGRTLRGPLFFWGGFYKQCRAGALACKYSRGRLFYKILAALNVKFEKQTNRVIT
jgi:hypothetical protein